MKKKKTLVILLALFMLFMSPSFGSVSADSIEKKSEEDNLVLLQKLGYSPFEISSLSARTEDMRFAQLGYSKDELTDITEVTKQHLGNIEGKLIAVDTTYTQINPDGTLVEITEAEYEQKKREIQINSLCNPNIGCSDTETTSNWMRLTTTVSAISNTSPKEYLIKHSFQWLKKPTDQYKDAVGTGHNSNLTSIQDSEILTYSYDEEYSKNPIIGLGPWENRGTKTDYYMTAHKKGSGMGFEMSLRADTFNNSGQYRYSNHRGTLSYRVVKNNTAAIASDVSGHYLHLTKNITTSLGIDIRGTGTFSITSTTSYTPAIQTGVSFSL